MYYIFRLDVLSYKFGLSLPLETRGVIASYENARFFCSLRLSSQFNGRFSKVTMIFGAALFPTGLGLVLVYLPASLLFKTHMLV